MLVFQWVGKTLGAEQGSMTTSIHISHGVESNWVHICAREVKRSYIIMYLYVIQIYNHVLNIINLETKKFSYMYMYMLHYIQVYIFYQEAHAMVRAAKVKQVGAEKRFKEANNKVGGNIIPLRSQCYS